MIDKNRKYTIYDLIEAAVPYGAPLDAVSVDRFGTVVIDLRPKPKRCRGVIFLPNEETFTEARCPETACSGEYCQTHEYLKKAR